jgi:hypothetical protein
MSAFPPKGAIQKAWTDRDFGDLADVAVPGLPEENYAFVVRPLA